MEYVIYKIINKITGKSYVGKTNNLSARMKNHRNSTCCRYLYNAIKKYGWENFEVKVLQECTRDEAPVLELEYILRENTLVPNGYNLILETHQGRSFHEETLGKMSKNVQGINKSGRKYTSSYIGVRRSKNRDNFDMRLVKNGITYSKTFKSEIEAAESYDKLALHLYGSDARINFPEQLKNYLSSDLSKHSETILFRKKLTSSVKGVCFHKITQKWYAYYYSNKKQIRLGLFQTEQEAINKIKEYNESIK